MEIINRKISELTPYARNPRKNDGAVQYVANSIREFGFKVPKKTKKEISNNGFAVSEKER